ncbi:recombinase family protein [Candidatus Enterococcus lemimoniae]|uniref:Recombinase n=1 Tax=Candidatus Enterococcus lemimoniae TaxID=1834167 RepID=A0ABZ2T6J4_9ENTE|nr:recombinase family protein [Enterococcus sp. 12C11_DIV0727]OTO71108.1 hypothetical protein A5866_003358 [Enterococcus sp. 12C11_DIV0727]
MTQIRESQNRTLTTKKVWKVAIYLRLSQEDGKDESQSISNQRKIILEYLDNEFNANYEIIDTYIDDGISGVTTTHRAEFLRMISDVETKKVNTVICKSLSRAFRNSSDQSKYLREIFPQYQTRFITIDTPYIDTFLNPRQAYAMDVEFYGMFNGNYPIMISEEVSKTFKMMMNKGEFVSGFVPYGYVKGNTEETKYKLYIDEEAAETVRNIFNWYVYDGLSQVAIAEKLNSLGILSPASYKRKRGFNFTGVYPNNDGLWFSSTIRRTLDNEVYIGHMVQGKTRVTSPILKKSEKVPKEEWITVKNTHEPIISEDLFKKAQFIRQKRHRVKKNKWEVDLFSGFLKCADCGLTMTRSITRYTTKQNVKKKATYYVCSTYSSKSKKACSAHRIKQADIKEAVLGAIQNQIQTVSNLEEILNKNQREKIVRSDLKRLEKSLQSKQRELSKIESVADNLYIDWKTEVLTKDEYRRMKLSFDEKISHLKQVIENIKYELDEQTNKRDEITPYLEVFREHKNVTELNRAILLDLVEVIHVKEDKNIEVVFKFDNTYRKIVDSIQE